MIIGSCKVYMHAEWVYSLKDKRTVVKSIVEKIKNKFNVSIAEIENQDVHQSIVLGFACVSNDAGHVDSILQNVIRFIEDNTNAVIADIVIELL